MGNKILTLLILIALSIIFVGCSQKNPELAYSSKINKTCEHTGGKDYYSKGQVTLCDFTKSEEPGSASPIGCTLHEDFCTTNSQSKKELYKYRCEKNELTYERYVCPNECIDGACVN